MLVIPLQFWGAELVFHLCCRLKFYLNAPSVFAASVNYLIKCAPAFVPQPDNTPPHAVLGFFEQTHACMKSGGEKLDCYSVN